MFHNARSYLNTGPRFTAKNPSADICTGLKMQAGLKSLPSEAKTQLFSPSQCAVHLSLSCQSIWPISSFLGAAFSRYGLKLQNLDSQSTGQIHKHQIVMNVVFWKPLWNCSHKCFSVFMVALPRFSSMFLVNSEKEMILQRISGLFLQGQGISLFYQFQDFPLSITEILLPSSNLLKIVINDHFSS